MSSYVDTCHCLNGRHRIAFARWRSDLPSGGNRYDEELTAGLKARGLDVREYSVTGSWPFPDRHDLETFREMLTGDSTNDEHHWIIDNIVGAAAPEVLRAAAEDGRSIAMLMHYFGADERGLSSTVRARLAANEAEAVAAANTVIATSEWTAKEVAERYGRKDVTVAVPGVAPARIAPGSLHAGDPPQLLWLARLTQSKDPITLINALAELQDLHWTAQLVGPDAIDRELSDELRARIAATGLAERVEIRGAHVGHALEMIWEQTDLLVHTALTEAYGMVVTEALARGIPSLVPAGTGAAEAQHGIGAMFPPGDAVALSKLIRRWLTDASLQERWKAEAAAQRTTLPTWEDTARIVARALECSFRRVKVPRSNE